MFVMFTDGPARGTSPARVPGNPAGAQGWIKRGGFISPNTTVPTDWYTSYPNTGVGADPEQRRLLWLRRLDLMPAEVGAGSFWTGMVDWVAANGEGTEAIFQSIEDSWPDRLSYE